MKLSDLFHSREVINSPPPSIVVTTDNCPTQDYPGNVITQSQDDNSLSSDDDSLGQTSNDSGITHAPDDVDIG